MSMKSIRSSKESSPKSDCGQEVDIRQTILQGSFLPVTLMALAGNFPINDYIIDQS